MLLEVLLEVLLKVLSLSKAKGVKLAIKAFLLVSYFLFLSLVLVFLFKSSLGNYSEYSYI